MNRAKPDILYFGGVPLFIRHSRTSGVRKHRAIKGAETKAANAAAAAIWAAGVHMRPFKLADLAATGEVGPSGLPRSVEAEQYFRFTLSFADVKSECKMHGLPVSASKTKLVDSLIKLATKKPATNRGEVGGAKLEIESADKVRRALVADLRKGVVFDKKLKKKGANKMLRARFYNCAAELFGALFPHAAGKRKCKVDLTRDLKVGGIGKTLRYGGSLEHVRGSLSAAIDGSGTISVTGKYTMV